MVSLQALGAGDLWLARDLAVAPEQMRFAGGPAGDAEPDVDLHLIRANGVPVGMFKIDRRFPAKIVLARRGEIGLRGFFIDHRHQRHGLGTRAAAALTPYLQRVYRDATAVVLTVHLSNPAALACYERAGFQRTGDIWRLGTGGPRHFLRQDLGGGAPAAA